MISRKAGTYDKLILFETNYRLFRINPSVDGQLQKKFVLRTL